MRKQEVVVALGGSDATAEWLRDFIDKCRRIQAAGASRAARLRRFLSRTVPLTSSLKAHPRAAQPTSGRVALDSLARLLRRVGPPLEAARSAGAYANAWTAAGLKRDEVRNAAVLAWFLCPNGTHGLGPQVAAIFLDRMARDPTGSPLVLDMARTKVDTEYRPQGDGGTRVDIVLEDRHHVLFVEVKIDASEGHHQLARYEKALAGLKKTCGLVYLSPSPPAALPAGAVWRTWRDLRSVLTAAESRLPPSTGRLLLQQFASHVRDF